MKRLLILAAIAASSLTASAQWTFQTTAADELTGTKEDIVYTYTDSLTGNTFTYYASVPDQYILHAEHSTFNYKVLRSQYGTFSGLEVTVGLYDASGTLSTKFDMWLDVQAGEGTADYARTRNAGKLLNPVGQAKKVKKILNHLTTTDGYVRIVAPLYGGTTFNLTIPSK